jgi:hypothetical protein
VVSMNGSLLIGPPADRHPNRNPFIKGYCAGSSRSRPGTPAPP